MYNFFENLPIYILTIEIGRKMISYYFEGLDGVTASMNSHLLYSCQQTIPHRVRSWDQPVPM